MRLAIMAAAGLIALAQLTSTARAAALRVAPVMIDLSAPSAASSVKLWNDGEKPVNVQIRIFRWAQKDGKDVYLPAEGIAVSPPITTLKSNAENIVRIVRTTKAPVSGEESYRLIVDELPKPGPRAAGTVTLIVRQSIPVFFSSPETGAASVRWAVRRQQNSYLVTAENRGGKRLRISDMTLSDGASVIGSKIGLVGYALGNSSASWLIPAKAGGSGAIKIHALSEAGPFDATARIVGK
ncbi:molecular chaperone [Neorhizobium galegae]|uniref:Molecular chaperone n=1 Tax=Neorhizobium galegae TaxID=399 RepID=A0A6A1TGZ2_NEOGA|nr:molecular chaperone [Neorhizobium galegae]KAB1082376.1 molecular chaperone [Neorhizobium galegae]